MSVSERFQRDTGLRAAVEEVDTATSIECGFRQLMFTAEGEFGDGTPLEMEVSSGGGCGTPWLMFSVNKRRFRLDARIIARELVEYVEASS